MLSVHKAQTLRWCTTQGFTTVFHSRLSRTLRLWQQCLGRNILTYSDLEQNYLADALLSPCVFITWGATQVSVNTFIFISWLDLLSPTCFCPLLLLSFHVLKHNALPHFSIFRAATLVHVGPAKINSDSRYRRGVSNKLLPFLYFMKYDHWRDCSCSAEAAQQTFYSIVCCWETTGYIQLLVLTLSDSIWYRPQQSDLDICSRVCGAISEVVGFLPHAVPLHRQCGLGAIHCAGFLHVQCQSWRTGESLGASRWRCGGSRALSAHALKCMHWKIMRKRWEQQLSLRIDSGGKRHRLMAKRLIDLCFIEKNKKNKSSQFLLLEVKANLCPFHRVSTGEAKAFITSQSSE